VFRTDAGVAVVADAHCPHLGAHVGHGGVVEGEGIRCPFHGWRFGVDGRCEDVPYGSDRRPPRVGLSTYPVRETSGLVFMHFSEAGRAPTWHLPDVPEWGADGWVGYRTHTWIVRMHAQELIENAPDTAHFAHVHRLPGTPAAECGTDGHIYRQRSYFAETGETFTSQEAHGIGLIWLRSKGPNGDTVLLATITPVDEERCELRWEFLCFEGSGATQLSAETEATLERVCAQNEADIPIWEHKVYRDRAPLVAGDGPINVVRRWARQFYETPIAERNVGGLRTDR